MTRPMAAPEPFEEEQWWRSSGALDILTELDAVARASRGRVEVVVTPFTPPPTLQGAVLLQGDTFPVDSLSELEAVAREALRRREEES